MHTNFSDAQEPAVDERIRHYENELRTLNQPNTFRENVLRNVYQCLLHKDQAQKTGHRHSNANA